jgi:hypothetical protein
MASLWVQPIMYENYFELTNFSNCNIVILHLQMSHYGSKYINSEVIDRNSKISRLSKERNQRERV